MLTTSEITPESAWLTKRGEFLTGTDAAAICRISPWTSPFEIWARKTGLLRQEPLDSEAAYWGLQFEGPIMDAFRRRTGRISSGTAGVWRELLGDGDAPQVLELDHEEIVDGHLLKSKKVMLVGHELDFIACSPDFVLANYTYHGEIATWATRPHYNFDGPGMGDVKTTSARAQHYWTAEGWEERLRERPSSDLQEHMLTEVDLEGNWMPPDVWIQMQHNMGVSGLSWGSVPVLFGGQLLDVRDIARDGTALRLITDELCSFHTMYLEADTGEHPPMVGLDSERDMVKNLYPGVAEAQEVTLTYEHTEMEARKRGLGKQIRLLIKEQGVIKDELAAAMGEAAIGHLPGSEYYLKRSHRFRGPSKPVEYVETRSMKAKRS